MPLVNPGPIDPIIGPFDPALTVALTAGAANTAYFHAFQVNRPVTVTAAWFRIGTASGNIDVGIYNSAGSRVASSGSIACPTAAVNATATFTAAVTLAPGTKYYAAQAGSDAVATVGSVGGISPAFSGSAPDGGAIASSFPLPATITIANIAGSGIARVIVFA